MADDSLLPLSAEEKLALVAGLSVSGPTTEPKASKPQ
jgi:hypothetical protein